MSESQPRGPAVMDWPRRAKLWARNLTEELRAEAARLIGVPADTLWRMPLLGYDPRGKAWTFPEHDADGRVTGILRRHADGRKTFLAGGRRGLCWPGGWADDTGPLLIVEGHTNVLALAAAGLAAVGRPGKAADVELLLALLRTHRPERDILVVGEHDAKSDGTWPGRDGAVRVAQQLADGLRRPVSWSLPPDGARDARAWLGRQLPRGTAEEWAANGSALLAALRGVAHRLTPGPLVGTINLVRLDEVAEERLEWLWPGWVPKGAITLIDGDPGVGKSALAFDLAARVTRGWPMPPEEPDRSADGPGEPRAVLAVASGEDPRESVVKPRLVAAGAAGSRLFVADSVTAADGSLRPVSLADDLAGLEAEVRRVKPALIIIDPLMAHLSGPAGYGDAGRALARLARLAAETGAAVLLVRHLNKNASLASLYRGGGPIGIIGAARSALVVGRHPEDADERDGRLVVAMNKCNLGPTPASRELRVLPAGDAAAVSWGGEVPYTAAELLTVRRRAGAAMPASPTKCEECQAVLAELLAGGPKPSEEVFAACAAVGYRPGTVRRALAELGAVREKESRPNGRWLIGLGSDAGETP